MEFDALARQGEEMALIIFRTKAGEILRQKGGTFNLEEGERQGAAWRKLFQEVGLNRVRTARSLNGRLVHILEGPPEGAIMMEQVLSATGAYEEVEAEILEVVEDVKSRSDRVRKLAGSFRNPNRDEIDRLLLDE